MLPVSDRVVVERVEAGKIGEVVLADSGPVTAVVLAVGKGVPYGRGEFYEPTLKSGDLVIIPRKSWDAAEVVRLLVQGRGKHSPLRVLHEREILMKVEENEL